MMSKGVITHAIVQDVIYPRFGWSRCDRCARVRLLYYVTPRVDGLAFCRPCLTAVAMTSGSDRARVAGMAEKTDAPAKDQPDAVSEPLHAANDTKAGKGPPAEAQRAAQTEKFICTCGQTASGTSAADKHREQCTGQWLAEPAKA